MKQKMVIIASVVMLSLSGVPEAGAQWKQVGLANNSITCFAANGSNLFAGTIDSGVFLSTDDGATWTSANNGLPDIFPIDDYPNFVQCFAVSGNNLFAGLITQGGSAVYRSSNNGVSWTSLMFGIFPTGPELIALAVSDTNIFASQGYASLSTNNGTSWISEDSGLEGKIIVLSLATIGNNIFAGGELLDSNGGVFLSTDNGTNWKSESSGLPNNLAPVNTLVANNSNLYAGLGIRGLGEGWVYVSTDSGSNWSQAGNSLPSNRGYVTSFAFSGGNVFVGLSNGGVYLLPNNANNWINVNAGLDSNLGSQDTGVSALTVADGYIFAGSGGVWRRPLSDFGIAAVAPSTSIQNSLTSYPNPLSQSTTISFSSPESGVAEVTIVNLLGAEVKRIFSGEIEAGEHSFGWDAISEPPGMYECVVRVNGNSQEIPIVLEK